MKRFLITLSLFFIATTTARFLCASEYEQFLQGNKAYQSGDYIKALEMYNAIPDKGPVLWHNTGLCYLQQKDYLNAFIAFSQGQRGASFSLFTQITALRDKVADTLGVAPEPFMVRFLRAFAAYVPLIFLQLLVIALLMLVMLVWTVYLSINHFIKFLLVFLCIVGMVGLCGLRWINDRTYGIILQDSLVYVGPNENFHSNGSVKLGQCVSSMKHKEGWFKITTHDVTGWVDKTRMVPIE